MCKNLLLTNYEDDFNTSLSCWIEGTHVFVCVFCICVSDTVCVFVCLCVWVCVWVSVLMRMSLCV